MSIGFVQLGQCGNQLGESILQFMATEASNSNPASQALFQETFFHDDQIANALLIDMEPKVVNRCLSNKYQSWKYSPKLSFTKQEGSGNNWGYGFNMHGPLIEEHVLTLMNRLLDSNENLEGLFFISSLAGGTGSGVGSYIQQTIMDHYPELILMNLCVVPHLSGEVILQSLNSILTISRLYQSSSGIILFQNDDAALACNHLLSIKKPSLDEINNIMSTIFSSVMYPAVSSNTQIYSTLQNNIQYFQDFQEEMLLDSRYKLLEVKHAPLMASQSRAFTSDQWNTLEKRIWQMAYSGCNEFNINWSKRKMNKSLGGIVIARGLDSQKYEFSSNEFKIIKDVHQFNKIEKSISIIQNSAGVIEQLDQIGQRANELLKEMAYVYQYEKFGVSFDDLLESLCMVEGIINNYNNIE